MLPTTQSNPNIPSSLWKRRSLGVDVGTQYCSDVACRRWVSFSVVRAVKASWCNVSPTYLGHRSPPAAWGRRTGTAGLGNFILKGFPALSAVLRHVTPRRFDSSDNAEATAETVRRYDYILSLLLWSQETKTIIHEMNLINQNLG